ICSLTGLVLLSSGVWTEKYENKFQESDMIVLSETYSETNKNDVEKLHNYLVGKTDIALYTGKLVVTEGIIQNPPTIINSRSVAEEVKVWSNNQSFSGELEFKNGKLVSQPGLYLSGKS